MEEYRITIAEQSKYEIELCAVQCGRDYSVTICGGGRHHVGAAALGCDESGTVGHKMRGATVSVLCVFGHRDDEAARWAAKYLATELKCNVSVAVGIHIDHADGSEIQCLLENCREACRQFKDRCGRTGWLKAGESGGRVRRRTVQPNPNGGDRGEASASPL